MKYLLIIVVIVIFFAVWHFLKKHHSTDDFKGNPFDPQVIKTRRENLDKIIKLAGSKQKITAKEICKELKIPEDMALRYLKYLTDLGKLVQMGERGGEAYYQLPPNS